MHSSFLKSLILIILASTFFSGCDKKNQQSEIILVDKEFTVLPFEQLTENGGNFQLRLSSISVENCGGVRIGYEQFASSSHIGVTINELKYPSVCNGISDTAKDTVTFGGLKNGNYNFSISLGKTIKNSGTLTINDAFYQISLSKENGIKILNTQLLRIPKGTVWGFIGYDKEQENKFVELTNSLSKITNNPNLSDGYYGYFHASDNEVDIVDSFITNKNLVKKVIYNLNTSQKELQDLIAKWKNYGFDIKMYTYDGKIL